MTHDPTTGHLTDDALIRAAIDRADLTAADRDHLDRCSRCAETLAGLTGDLDRVGTLAREAAPSPARPIRLPAQAPALPRRLIWAPAAAALLIALILAGQLVLDRFPGPVPDPTAELRAEMAADGAFLREVRTLETAGLPDPFGEIAEPSGYFGDDFLDFVVPEINDTQPRSSQQEGGIQWT
jgi:hypothetical protein